jgi:hypothetical protein
MADKFAWLVFELASHLDRCPARYFYAQVELAVSPFLISNKSIRSKGRRRCAP